MKTMTLYAAVFLSGLLIGFLIRKRPVVRTTVFYQAPAEMFTNISVSRVVDENGAEWVRATANGGGIALPAKWPLTAGSAGVHYSSDDWRTDKYQTEK